MSEIIKKNVMLNFDVNSKGVKKGTDEAKKGINGLNKVSQDLQNRLEQTFGVPISSVKEYVGGLGATTKATNTTTAATSRLGKAFQALKATLVSTGIGALVIGLATAVVTLFKAAKAGAAFQKELSNVRAVLGELATEEAMSKLEQDARRLGASTAFAASEVAQLQTEFAKLGLSPDQIINSTEATLDLAAALGTSLPEAASLAGSTVAAFGLQSSDTQRVVDVLAKSTSTSALDFESLVQALKIAIPTARATGQSLEETVAQLGALANAGLKGSVAGTGLQTVLIQLSNKGISLSEAFDIVTNSTNKLNTAAELVGTEGAKSLLTLTNTQGDVESLSDSLLNAEGSARALAETKLDNLAGDVTKLSSAWEGLLLSIDNGNGALGRFLRTAVQVTTQVLSFFTPALEGNASAIRKSQTEFNILIDTLKRGNISFKNKGRLITEINSKYSQYLPNLLTEKSSLEEIEAAQKSANVAFREKITLLAAEDRLKEITQKRFDAELRQLTLQEKLTRDLLRVQELRSTSLERMRAKPYRGVDQDLQAAQKSLENTRKAIIENEKETGELEERYESILSLLKDLNPEFELQEEQINEVTGALGGTKRKIQEVIEITRISVTELKSQAKELMLVGEAGAEAYDSIINKANQYLQELGLIEERVNQFTLSNIAYRTEESIKQINLRETAQLKAAQAKIQNEQDLENEITRITRQAENDRAIIRENSLQQSLEATSFYVSQVSSEIGSIWSSINQIQANADQEQLNSLQERLDAELISQEQYDQRVRQIQAEQAKREKNLAIFEATINAFTGFTKALAQKGPLGYVTGALVLAAGLAKVAAIKSEPTPQFAKGVIDFKGKGTETSDSNTVRISKGESVITAKGTDKNRDILSMANKGLDVRNEIAKKSMDFSQKRKSINRRKERKSLERKSDKAFNLKNYKDLAREIGRYTGNTGYSKLK